MSALMRMISLLRGEKDGIDTLSTTTSHPDLGAKMGLLSVAGHDILLITRQEPLGLMYCVIWYGI